MLNFSKIMNRKYLHYFNLDVSDDINHHSLVKSKIDIVSLKIL